MPRPGGADVRGASTDLRVRPSIVVNRKGAGIPGGNAGAALRPVPQAGGAPNAPETVRRKGVARPVGMTEGHANASLALSTMAPNAPGSLTARSASTLRSTSIPALDKPLMNRE